MIENATAIVARTGTAVVIDVDNAISSDKRLIGVEEVVVADSNVVIAGVTVVMEDMAMGVDVAETIANGWQTSEEVVVVLMSAATVDHRQVVEVIVAAEAAEAVEVAEAAVVTIVIDVTTEVEVAEEDSEIGIFGMATATAMEAINATPIAGCHKEKRMTRKYRLRYHRTTTSHPPR